MNGQEYLKSDELKICSISYLIELIFHVLIILTVRRIIALGVIITKCYLCKMLSIQNVTSTKCDLYEMLPIYKVYMYENEPRQNVNIKI